MIALLVDVFYKLAQVFSVLTFFVLSFLVVSPTFADDQTVSLVGAGSTVNGSISNVSITSTVNIIQQIVKEDGKKKKSDCGFWVFEETTDDSFVDDFYARKSVNVKELIAKLKQHGMIAITGPMGSGKTQLAYYYALKIFNPEKVVPIFVIPCDTAENLNAKYREFAIELGMSQNDNKDFTKNIEDIKIYVKKQLESEECKQCEDRSFILIFDNCKLSYEKIKSYLPVNLDHSRQQIILISQKPDFFVDKNKNFSINGFSNNEAIDFLLRDFSIQEDEARRIVEIIGVLPLWLQYAKTYLKIIGISVDEYLKLIASEVALMQNKEELNEGDQDACNVLEEKYGAKEATAILLVNHLSFEAKYILNCCSLFYTDNISISILKYLLSVEFNLADNLASVKLNAILKEYKDHSITHMQSLGSNSISISPFIQSVVRSKKNNNVERKKVVTRVVDYFNSLIGQHNDALDKYNGAIRLFYDHGDLLETARYFFVDGNVDKAQGDEWTALMLAAAYGQLEVVEFLLERGVEINKEDDNSWTALMVASFYGHAKIVRLLLENGAEVNWASDSGWTALMLASAYNHLNVATLLLEKGAKVNKKLDNGWTALMVASFYGSPEIIKLLIKRKAYVDEESDDSWTALMLASENGRWKSVKLLLEAGATVDKVEYDDWTALMIASFYGHQEVVELLIANGADINKKIGNGKSAIVFASENGHQEIVKKLSENKSEIIDVLSAEIKSFVHTVQACIPDNRKLFVDVMAAEINRKRKKMRSSFMRAVRSDYLEIAESIIKDGEVQIAAVDRSLSEPISSVYVSQEDRSFCPDFDVARYWDKHDWANWSNSLSIGLSKKDYEIPRGGDVVKWAQKFGSRIDNVGSSRTNAVGRCRGVTKNRELYIDWFISSRDKENKIGNDERKAFLKTISEVEDHKVRQLLIKKGTKINKLLDKEWDAFVIAFSDVNIYMKGVEQFVDASIKVNKARSELAMLMNAVSQGSGIEKIKQLIREEEKRTKGDKLSIPQTSSMEVMNLLLGRKARLIDAYPWQ